MNDHPDPLPGAAVAGAVHHILTAARTAKETLDPFPPILIWTTPDGEAGISPLHHEPGRSLTTTTREILTELPRTLNQPFTWFALIVDGYGRITDTDEDIDPEELTDRFILGDPVVVEQLIALVAHDGTISPWRQVYRNTPIDGWEWDRPEYMPYAVLPRTPGDDLMQLLEQHATLTGPTPPYLT